MKALKFAQNFGLQELEMRANKFIANDSKLRNMRLRSINEKKFQKLISFF
jgi:hypothetical protein